MPGKPRLNGARLGLMTNHLHMICSCKQGNDIALVLRNIKSFTAMKLIDAIIKNPKKSRGKNILNLFVAEGKRAVLISDLSFGNTRTIPYYLILHWFTAKVELLALESCNGRLCYKTMALKT